MKKVIGKDGKLLGVIIGDVCFDRRNFTDWGSFLINIAQHVIDNALLDTDSTTAKRMVRADDKRLAKLLKKSK